MSTTRTRPKPPRRMFRCHRRGDVLHVGSPHCRRPNYAPLVDALIARHRGEFEAGEVRRVTIAHDDDCAFFGGRACDCNPDVTLAAAR